MNGWHAIGKLEEIPRQGARVVETDVAGRIAVFRTNTDSVYALANKCPHKGGPLSEGIVHGEKVTCPLHNWTLDLASGRAVGADEGCAASFPVKLEDGELFLALDQNDAT